MVHWAHSATSPASSAVGGVATTTYTVPPWPEAEYPRAVASPGAGSASPAHWAGSALQPGPKPHSPATLTGPATSAIS